MDHREWIDARVFETPPTEMRLFSHLNPLLRSALMLATLFVVGTVGYRWIGGSDYSLLDAAYMTTITLTTLGYYEVIDLSDNAAGRLFTMALLMVGVSFFLYFFGALTAFVVEGSLTRIFWRRRMARKVDALQHHYIVCGGGRTGEHVLRELLETQRPCVLVESDPSRIDELHERLGVEFPVVIGDATDDDTLRSAGVDRAAGLVTCMSGDNDNLVVIFSARALNAGLRIVSRTADPRSEDKLRRAGADGVVSPNRIGGLRMISEMIRPTVVSFLDSMLRDPDSRLRVEEAEIQLASELDGSTLGDLRSRSIDGLVLVGIGQLQGDWAYNPPNSTRLEAGMKLIFIGNPSTRALMEKLTSHLPAAT